MKKFGDYYKWKAGELKRKAPWVIKYYKSITDEHQYDLGRIVEKRALLIIVFMVSIYCFLLGITVGVFFL